MKSSGLWLISALLALSAALEASAREPVKRYLAYGWDTENISPEDLLEGAAGFRELGFDGAGICVEPKKTPDGRVLTRKTVCDGKTVWTDADVAPYLPALKKIARTPGLRYSMLHFLLGSKDRIRWDDDARWKICAGNLLVMARLARRASLPGLCLDNEDYWKAGQYVRKMQDPPYDVSVKLARRRGRELFGPVFKEYPDIVIHFYFMLNLLWECYDVGNPAAVATARQELYPAFFDGIYDVMPPTARLIDGCEMSYTATPEKKTFRRLVSQMLAGVRPLLSPENRGKFRAQTSISFATYLDAYIITNTGSCWYQAPMANGSRLQRLERNLVEMNRFADDYVWFWGERKNYADYTRPARRRNWVDGRGLWKDALPGLGQVLRGIKDPYGYVGAELDARRKSGTLKSVVPQSAWKGSVWKQPCEVLTNGVFLSEAHPRALLSKGLTSGAFSVDVKGVKAGEWYGVEVNASDCNICGYARGKDARAAWVKGVDPEYWDVRGPDAGGWYTGRILMRVPEGASAFSVLLWPNEQKPGEKTYYDGLVVVRLR